MHSDRLGWTFAPEKPDNPQPPDQPTIVALGLLIEEGRAWGAKRAGPSRTQVWYPVQVLSEVIGSRAASWLTSSLRVGRTKEVPTNMPINEDWKSQNEELETQLLNTMSRPELAEQSFPDQHMREKVVPFFQYLRRRVESGDSK